MMGVSDLSNGKGNIPFIYHNGTNRAPISLRIGVVFSHLRQVHFKEVVSSIIEPVQDLFSISLCLKCELHYSNSSIANHNCKAGVVRRLQHPQPITQSTTPKPRTNQAKTTKIMLRPSEISLELVDRLLVISYNKIFSSQA